MGRRGMARPLTTRLLLRPADRTSQRAVLAVVAAMSALASFAIAGWSAASSLSSAWQGDGTDIVTIEIPAPPPQPAQPATETSRAQAVVTHLGQLKGVTQARLLPPQEVADLMAPWLGRAQNLSLALPAVVIATRTADLPVARIAATVQEVAPDAAIEENLQWGERLARLGGSLQLCAMVATALAALSCACILGMSVLTSLASHRRTIGILHDLGATDGLIAGRIALRSGGVAFLGAMIGTLLALPVLTYLYQASAPFRNVNTFAPWPATARAWFLVAWALPRPLIGAIAALPPAVCAIGWLAGQSCVRLWLRRLP